MSSYSTDRARCHSPPRPNAVMMAAKNDASSSTPSSTAASTQVRASSQRPALGAHDDGFVFRTAVSCRVFSFGGYVAV